MPRLFISHSGVDNVAALAFQRWLIANGWSEEDVFIDLHGIGAGERWRDTLRKANASCEAVILLASPDSLDSKECQREINLAEDLGKPILVVILRDLSNDDARLARFADTQLVNLSAEPLERMESFEHEGKLQRVSFNLAALLSIKRSLEARGIAPGSFTWSPHRPGDGPYPGLAAFVRLAPQPQLAESRRSSDDAMCHKLTSEMQVSGSAASLTTSPAGRHWSLRYCAAPRQPSSNSWHRRRH